MAQANPRERLAGLLGRVGYGLFYLAMAGLLIGLPAWALWWLGSWIWG